MERDYRILRPALQKGTRGRPVCSRGSHESRDRQTSGPDRTYHQELSVPHLRETWRFYPGRTGGLCTGLWTTRRLGNRAGFEKTRSAYFGRVIPAASSWQAAEKLFLIPAIHLSG